MNIISIKKRLDQAIAAKGEKTISRAELDARIEAFGLDPETEWDWIATNKIGYLDIVQRAAKHFGVSQETVLSACHE